MRQSISANKYTNALAGETSPYLLQHAHNPVDWHPWNDESLRLAQEQQRPILLSIGYSACHWCHVMAHESFEDAETADIMNRLFINIKVDREERPDLDRIYQLSHQLLTGRPGGWPLTMFLTPDQLPFFGGTYFPNQARHGLPAFDDLLAHVARFYHEHKEDIEQQNQSLLDALNNAQQAATAAAGHMDAAPLRQARKQLERSYDARYGGFGQAPKFPHPTNIERLLRDHAASCKDNKTDNRALEMVRNSLHAMAAGGIYDQIGGGFCRYSVDNEWTIPHFEKMLYDNGQLLGLYVDSFAQTGDGAFARVATETADWVMREMQSPEGGYYAALDADSEGEEGRYYAWTPDEARALLTRNEFHLASCHYGLDRPANFESRWHLRVIRTLEDCADKHGLTPAAASEHLASAKRKLFAAREQRPRPGRDDKVLAAWNGLMIRGMACAGRRLDEPRFTASAEKALDFIHGHMWHDGRLKAGYKDGAANLNAYLDDHAFLVSGILELLQCRWRSRDLEFAINLADVLLQHFEDEAHGGFFFTSDDHETLIQRPKSFMDDALPAGNGVAAWALARLGHLLGNIDYLNAAEKALQAAWQAISELPHAHGAMLLALEEYLAPPTLVIVRGNRESLPAWQAPINHTYHPAVMAVVIPSDSRAIPAALEKFTAAKDTRAYVCRGTQCLPPAASPEELLHLIGQNSQTKNRASPV